MSYSSKSIKQILSYMRIPAYSIFDKKVFEDSP